MPADEKEVLTKTGSVRQFFENHGNEVLSPTDVANELKMSPDVVTVIVNRLFQEKFLKRAERGKFFRVPTFTEREFRAAHDAIAKVVESLIGRDVASSMMGDKSLSWKDGGGPQAVNELLSGVRKVFGREYADRLVEHALATALPSRWKPLLQLVEEGSK